MSDDDNAQTVNPSQPDKIVSFQVIPENYHAFHAEDGTQMQSIVEEHTVVLDSFGKLWARHLSKNNWICLNPDT